MPARLVQIEDGQRVRSSTIRGDECVLGRDPTSQIVFDFARVSRQHAAVRTLGERHTLADLGSSNGTKVNGRPIGQEPTLLQPGDMVELAETVLLVYERGPSASTRRWIALAAAMVGLLLFLAATSWWRLSADPADEILDRAAAIASEGLDAFEAGDPVLAKKHLQRAAGVLFHEGRLDDVPRSLVMEEAMNRLAGRIGGGVDLWSIFQESLELSIPPTPEPEEVAASECRLDEVPWQRIRECLEERVELVMLELHQDPEGIPEDFPDQVGHRIRYEHDLLVVALDRGESLVPMLRDELEKARMPPILHYLALVESLYDPKATSPAGARGLWQFMPGTARQYGMRVGGNTDERTDPHKSTVAAARYLRDLAFEFGGDALLLALAGYNRGENGVRRALKKLEDPFSDRSYWRLVEEGLLPHETARYVTRFVAAAVAGEAGLPRIEDLEAAGF